MDGEVLGAVVSCPNTLEKCSREWVSAVTLFVEVAPYVFVVWARLTVDMAGSLCPVAELLRLSRLKDGEMVSGCAECLSMVCRCSLESPQRFRWASSICLLRRSCSSSITIQIGVDLFDGAHLSIPCFG
jgi:hypothetical protein